MKNVTETKGWINLFEQVLESIQLKANLRNHISTISGCRQFSLLDDKTITSIISSAINELKMKVNEYIPNTSDGFKVSTSRGKVKKNLELSEKRSEANRNRKKLEESLERAIVASFDDSDSLYNQFSLLSGVNNSSHLGKRGSIDIIDCRETDCIRMIELKQWKNTNDSPISSILELVAYYYAFQKLFKVDKNNFKIKPNSKYRLNVLAPSSYFEFWKQTLDKLQIVVNAINNILKNEKDSDVIVSINILPIQRDEFIDMISDVSGSYKNIPEDSKKKIRKAYLKAIKES